MRGNGPPRAYDLVWLTQSLNGGLASLPHELGLSDLEPMRLSFRAYFDEGQLLMDVAAGKTAGSPIS